MKQNTYEIEKNIEKIEMGIPTGFLTQNIVLHLKRKLKHYKYQEFIPYPDAEKTILYSNTLPCVKLFKIECGYPLKHSSILGSLFSLNITSEVFGDIVFSQNNFYVYLLESISDLVLNELTMIDRFPVKLIEVDLNVLSHYKRQYEEIELIVSSLRLDTIIAKLIGCNRKSIQGFIREQNIFLNYELANRLEYLLKEFDVFSIRGYGKYRFEKVIARTKKENYIILLKKYI